MNNLKESDFLSAFPPALKKNETFLTLGKLIAEELHTTAQEAEKNIIYANIDSLSETWLDILAYDLHVDWYDYDYPIEAKRAVIKDSVRVHQKIGTKAAVEMALGNIHPLSEIEEWFDYDGKPYRFRIVLDTTKSRVQADYDEIIKTVDIYKRLTAHLDGLYYQCSMSVVVLPTTEYFLFRTPMTGQLKTGTEPYRNREGAVANGNVIIEPTAAGHRVEAIRTGTKPDRNIVFSIQDSGIVTDSDTQDYRYKSNQTGKATTGTTPYTSTVGGAATEGVDTQTEGKSYKFDSDFTGTKPDRNIMFLSEEVAAVGETEADNYIFDNAFTGTTPHKNIVYAEGENEVVADSETDNYGYDTSMTGQATTSTEPSRAVETAREEKGIAQTADTESYQYSVKRCGSNGLSK
ncbi:phage tail protein I [Bacteroides sp.]|uniref:phage tail protein I n=1 Tax=Bacteroides sp. TaxID=29523 RepID=UPI0026172A0B|nr:phage tail protein I [Bacteroides sp.]MDD3040508.1 phage tail protein I [Bacteroides sp.]